MNNLPIGAVLTFAMPQAPTDWLVCDGSEYHISEYPELFDAIGRIYGGDGIHTFCVPNLQGCFVRGWDTDGNIDPERDFGSFQEDAFQGHNHNLEIQSNYETESGGRHYHYLDQMRTQVGNGLGPHKTICIPCNDSGTLTSATSGEHRHKLPSMSIGIPTSFMYGEIHVNNETRPKNIALLYCIKAR